MIADGTDAKAQFAVEYDGPQHLSDPTTMGRDRMKSEICARLGLPLVRIGSEYLQRERRFTLIGYLVEVWSLERAFASAQESGMIPCDEPFMPQMIIADSVQGESDFPTGSNDQRGYRWLPQSAPASSCPRPQRS